MNKESIYIQQASGDRLHLQRFNTAPHGEPVFMVHGSIEDGRIFYSDSGKGLAPYLAAQGFDVFVADLRGRGKSTPAISKASAYGLSEILQEDIPAFIKKIEDIKGPVPQHWLAHSWGGVLQLAYLARYQQNERVASMVFFGSKRHISTTSLKKILMIDIMWRLVANTVKRFKGYLPAKALGMGSDNETIRTHAETDAWVRSKQWLDWQDGFDYAHALKHTQLPPALYLTGVKDLVLGHPNDVKLLANETGSSPKKVVVVGRHNGFKHDYDHINLLTHKEAPEDHFTLVSDWLKKYSYASIDQ
jgi:predicted alpha/beta hydrolase